MDRVPDNIVPITRDLRTAAAKFSEEHDRELLTILFTDLVDSTKLQTELGNVEAARLNELHRTIVRDELGKYDAREISWAGDSCLAVFTKPSDAVVFALRTQAEHRRAREKESRLPLVRIGMHLGEVVVKKGDNTEDLFGVQVSEAARVMSVAQGNQIFCTRPVFDNARSALKGSPIKGAGEVVWVNYGPYTLKGSEDPVELCEVGSSHVAVLRAPKPSDKVSPLLPQAAMTPHAPPPNTAIAGTANRLPRWAFAIVVLVLAVLGGFVGRSMPPPSQSNEIGSSPQLEPAQRPIRRYSINLDPDHPIATDFYTLDYGPLAVSPHGRELLYPVESDGGRIYMARSLDRLDARPIPGTENAHHFKPSPSGRWAVMHKDSAYWKIPYEGGRAEKILDASMVLMGVWEDESHAIFGSPEPAQGLVRIDLDTGRTETITKPDRSKGEVFHVSYQVVRDKRVLIYVASTGTHEHNVAYALSLDTMESTLIASDGMLHTRYVDSGHILYASLGRLMALPYDIDRLEVTGPATEVTPPYMASSTNFPQGFGIMPDGDLIYVRSAGLGGEQRRLVWVDLEGNETDTEAPEMRYQQIALADTGSLLRILFVDGEYTDSWIYDIGGGLPPQQLTFDRNGSGAPLWIDDGKHYVYTGPNDSGGQSIYRRSADGLGTDNELTRTTSDQWFVSASGLTPDRSALLGYVENASGTATQAIQIPLNDSDQTKPIFDVDYATAAPVASPDGQWLAYGSSELGAYDIFVTSYPDLLGKWRVTSTENPIHSNTRPDRPIWAPDGSAIYYRGATHLIRVPVTTENGFRLGRPEQLFEDRYIKPAGTASSFYALHPDGQRFLFVKPVLGHIGNATELIVIENWLDTLRNPDRDSSEQ